MVWTVSSFIADFITEPENIYVQTLYAAYNGDLPELIGYWCHFYDRKRIGKENAESEFYKALKDFKLPQRKAQ